MYHSLKGHCETKVIAANISKAFDRVWHLGLVSKLPSFGFYQSTIVWSISFLDDRQIRTIVDGIQSGYFKINAVVSQGSVLTSTLFILYISDLPSS